MKIKDLIYSHNIELTEKYGHHLLPSHRKALDAMLACRSHCGEFYTHCDHCDMYNSLPLSCGHRSCPQCQNHLGRLWLERQKQKLLPVEYFLVTFTVPQELRELVWQHQSTLYDILFKASVESIKTIGLNNHSMELAMTAVLHTHKRDKGYHPHIHLVVPGGGLIKTKKSIAWKALDENFLVNEFALASIFRGIFLRLLFEQAFELPQGLPNSWVAKIICVGKGEKTLKYLSRYLYRGVISENDILTDTNGKVTFSYRESGTNAVKTKSLPPADFLWKILRHVLPRGFHRVRDYGFLHANAKLILKRVQLLLQVKLPQELPLKTAMRCITCKQTIEIIMVIPKRIPMMFRFYIKPIVVKPAS